MKELKYFFAFLLTVIALPKTEGRYISKYNPDSRIDRNADRYSRSKGQNIQVYIITNSEPTIQRTNDETLDLFDDNGMLYITNPKSEIDRKASEMYKYKIGRRNYDLGKKNRRKLMAMMNKELNRQLLAKANSLRRNNVKLEYDFNELVS